MANEKTGSIAALFLVVFVAFPICVLLHVGMSTLIMYFAWPGLGVAYFWVMPIIFSFALIGLGSNNGDKR